MVCLIAALTFFSVGRFAYRPAYLPRTPAEKSYSGCGYGDPHQIDFIGFLVHAIQSVRPDFTGLPTDPPPLEFQLADLEKLREELNAGLKDVKVERITETMEFRIGNALEWIISSHPIVERILGGMLNLTSKEREVVQEALEPAVRERASGAGVAKLRRPINIGIGTK